VRATGSAWESLRTAATEFHGSYGIPEGVIYGYPVTCESGKYKIVKGIQVSEFSRARMDATLKELHEERDSIRPLLG